MSAATLSPAPAGPGEATIALDGHRIAIGDPMRLAVDRMWTAMLAAEGDRQRQRRRVVAENDRRSLEALLCAAFWEARRGTGRWLGVSTGNRKGLHDGTRYGSPALANRRGLARCIAFLVGHGWLQYRVGYRKPDGRTGGMSYEALPTTVRATAALVSFVEADCGATLDDIGDGPCEVIRLRGRKPAERGKAGPLIDYTDTADTRRMRAELATINAALAHAAVTLEPGKVGAAGDDQTGTDDATERTWARDGITLYRVFNDGSFDAGGRLYGHWAQCVARRDRHRLRIAGEPVVEVDFAALHARMLYRRRGIDYPATADPYCPAMLGLGEVARDDVKAEFMRLVNRSTPPVRPTNASARRVVAAFRQAHAPIAADFYTGAGLSLMRQDSDIAARVMLTLVAGGIAALPLHDGFLVRVRDVAATKLAMQRAYAAVLGAGAVPVITEKHHASVEPKAYRMAA